MTFCLDVGKGDKMEPQNNTKISIYPELGGGQVEWQ